ncbi:MAG: hypothetical protein HOJ15_03005 [Candidatus Jacksonbacteria bacterium]|jgi:uncharacterized membrane protein|nr:hypothetical protein [Candidatus Jacksonbacteria bacterium]MBT6034361.1 hypothetical protein [Candidatus Jacksonbacteria bacterium]MBT6301366.1 hypothetical protein [Candidatus Jacksonbacteria bacterium]MBT6756740.1 hypothetical protein [Candidatus Jacksonbacteria bacterium]MBT6955275.1 hypothetical protein [Candidatus Jacksonbacteria bacterium]
MLRLIFLRIGFFVVFGFFGVMAFLQPEVYMSFVPEFAVGLTGLSQENLLFIAGALEIAVALMMLMWRFTRFGFSIAVVFLIAIVGSSLSLEQWDIAARDFGLLSASFYGMWRSWMI